MKEVTKEEFFAAINNTDAVMSTRDVVGASGRKSYATIFKERYGRALGEITPKEELERYPYFVKHYYLYLLV